MLIKLNKVFEKTLYRGTAISSILFFLIVVPSVMGRYLQAPILASIKLSCLFFVWPCFLAAVLTYRQKSHVGFTLLFEKIPVNIRYRVQQAIHAIILIFLLITLRQSILVTRLLWPTGPPMPGQSQLWLLVPVPVDNPR